jgi:Right handed beta helix region
VQHNRQESIMSRRIPLTLTFAALLVALLTAAPVRADLNIAWVSDDGDDNNNLVCSRVKPCRTFKTALANVAAGGEIRVLSQGSFDVVVINKSISIVGDGVSGVMALKTTAGAVTAITIAAGPNDVINLRGLIIEGAGVGVSGIKFESGAALHIQNSVIRGFRQFPDGYGIMFAPKAASQLYVTDTLVADNGGNLLVTTPALRSGAGIMIGPADTGSAKVVLDRVRVENNLVGIKIANNISATGTTLVTMRDSISAGNLNEGIFIQGVATQVTIDRSAVVNNGAAGISSNGGKLHTTLSNSLVSGNKDTGVFISDYGTLDHARNNIIVDNLPVNPDSRERNIDGDKCVYPSIC